MDCRDAIADLGFLALGTRLKRLAEQLQAGVAEVLLDQRASILPGQLPLLVIIGASAPLTIAELVAAVGTSQPAISRALGSLQRSGHVTILNDRDDARVRRVALTRKSRALLAQLGTGLFPKVESAANELCAGLDLLDCLTTIEERNRALPFARRIERQS